MSRWKTEAKHKHYQEIEAARLKYVQELWSKCRVQDKGLHSQQLAL